MHRVLPWHHYNWTSPPPKKSFEMTVLKNKKVAIPNTDSIFVSHSVFSYIFACFNKALHPFCTFLTTCKEMKGDSKPLHSIVLQGKGKVGQKKSPQCYFSNRCERELVFSKNVLCEQGLWAVLMTNNLTAVKMHSYLWDMLCLLWTFEQLSCKLTGLESLSHHCTCIYF